MAQTMIAPTRRAMLGGAVIAIAASATLAPVMAASADRTEWDGLMAALAVAKRAHDEADAAWERAHSRWLASRPDRPQEARRQFLGMRDDDLFDRQDLDKMAEHFDAGEGVWWFSPESKTNFYRATASIRDYRAKDQAAKVASGYQAASDRQEQTCDEVCRLLAALMALPAPDAAALRWKLEEGFGTDRATYPDNPETTPATCRRHLAQTFADMRRLLGGEA